MDAIIHLVGPVVIVMAILSFFGCVDRTPMAAPTTGRQSRVPSAQRTIRTANWPALDAYEKRFLR